MSNRIAQIFYAIMIIALLAAVAWPTTLAGDRAYAEEILDVGEIEPAVTYSLPTLDDGRDYYRVDFPSGTIYSSAWAGTFEYVPNGVRQVMFDDNYQDSGFGLCIFSLPAGSKPPSKPQGGTTLTTLTRPQVNTVLQAYDPEKLVKPFDDEILEVMPNTHKYIGAWAGDKLSQKFTSEPNVTETVTVIDEATKEEKTITRERAKTDRQTQYLEDTKNLETLAVDLEKYDPDRFFVMGQVFFADGTANCSIDGRIVVDSAFTVVGAGYFTISMANGTTGTVTGTNISGSPVTLVAGSNTITATGAVADGVFDITIGTAANWNTVNSWSATSGGACGASVPTSSDATLFDANSFTASGQTLTVDAVANCLSMDWTGATNSPTLLLSANLNYYGNITFIAAMSTSGVEYDMICAGNTPSLTTNGLTIVPRIVVNAGTLTFQNAVTCGSSSDIMIQGGVLDINGQSVTCRSLTIQGAGAKVVTLGASVLSLTGSGGYGWNYTGSNLTLTANTATINVAGTGNFAGGSITTYNIVNLNGTSHTVSGAFTCANLTRTGTAANTNSVTFPSSTTITVTSTLTLTGNSRANQLLCQSSTLDTAATISAAIVIVSNTDFMDITGAGAGSWDFSAQTDVGNAGGNTGLTFPAAVAQTWNGTTGSASNAAKWTSRIPLVGIDDVTVPTTGITFTDDMPRMGKSFTGTGTGTIALSQVTSFYGSLTLASGLTFTNANFTSFRGRGAFTITTAGKTVATGVTINIIAPSGTYTLQDNWTSNGSTLALQAGTFDFNGFNGSFTQIRADTGAGDKTRAYDFGEGTITVNSTAADAEAFNMTGTNLTVTAGTSTIVMTNTSAGGTSFKGNNKTYNNVTVQGAGNYALTITGNNRFNALRVDASQSAKTVKFTDTSVTTVADFTRDTGTNVITLNGTAAAGWSLTKTDATPVSLDYLSVDYSNATQAGVWYAGTHSTDGTHNTNWTFDDPTLTITTQAVTGLTMDKDGVTGGTFNGTITTDLDGTPRITTYFEYGATALYGSQTANVMMYDNGVFTGTLPAGLTPGGTYHFRAVSTNGNAGSPFNGADADFTLTMPAITTNVASGVTMDKDGVTGGTFNGNVTDLGEASDTYAYVEYGLTAAYGTSTASTTRNAIGAFAIAVPTTLTPGQTYHYRMNVMNGPTIVNGGDQSFAFTMPTITTTGNSTPGEGSTDISANLATMGVASSAYQYWRWGYDPACGNSTSAQTILGVGGITTELSGYSPYHDAVYYYPVVRVGAVITTGATMSFSIPAATTRYELMRVIFPLVAIIIAAAGVFGLIRSQKVDVVNGVLMILACIIVMVIIMALAESLL